MKERQFYVRPGLGEEAVCQFDGISMADNIIRMVDGVAKCALCGVALEL